MSKVITVSYRFPKAHPKAGEPTFFVEKIWKSLQESQHFDVNQWADNYHLLRDIFMNLDILNPIPKHHTIRAGKRWKDGDVASIRIWSDQPYRSKQIPIAPDVKIKVINVEIDIVGFILLDGKSSGPWIGNTSGQTKEIAQNDGLSCADFNNWFTLIHPLPFSGQILIWNDKNLSY
jgi:hypothetical protein